MRTKKRSIEAIVLLAALAVGTTAQAASITWGLATTISGDLDVSTNGALIEAYNFGNASVPSTTVNGVTFAPFAIDPLFGTTETFGNFTLATPNFLSAGGVGSGSAPFSGLSPSYQALVGDAAGTAAANVPLSLTMAGLSVGLTYQVQLWSNGSSAADSNSTTATAGNSVTLDWNNTNAVGGVGQFAIGTFTADASSQVINFTSASQNLVNAVQLRQISVATPEPATATLALLGLGGLLMRRRRLA